MRRLVSESLIPSQSFAKRQIDFVLHKLIQHLDSKPYHSLINNMTETMMILLMHESFDRSIRNPSCAFVFLK